MTLETITECEVCSNQELELALDLGPHPMCDDLIPLGETRTSRAYPIEILFCNNCSTAHQRFQLPKFDLFPTSYHYRPRFTADVLNGMSDLVDACEHRLKVSLNQQLVLDIGCNDASLLGFFKKKGARTIGVEPTSAYFDGLDQGHKLYNEYFNEEVANRILVECGSPKIITFTNVFAHIEDLRGLLRALKVLVTGHTIIVIENHYLGSVLQRNQFDTFYHEHIRTYSLTSFYHISQTLEMEIFGVEFPSRYGGNIRIFLGDKGLAGQIDHSLIESTLLLEKDFGRQLVQMRTNIDKWKEITGASIEDLLANHGPMVGKAFPGRAAILIKLLDLDADSLTAVYEKPESKKIGHYIPGTLIPIKSERELLLAKTQPDVILNLAWHISEEIKIYLKNKGFSGHVIDILNPKDFET